MYFVPKSLLNVLSLSYKDSTSFFLSALTIHLCGSPSFGHLASYVTDSIHLGHGCLALGQKLQLGEGK